MSEQDKQKRFKVLTPLSIRTEPGLSGSRLPEGLNPGAQIEVDGASQRELDGYVWWRHSAGWSAERKADGSEVYMQPVGEKVVPVKTEPTTETRLFRVITPLSVRTEPGLGSQRLPTAQLAPGQVIEVNRDSRREIDGYVWWRHSAGWSAERKADGSQVFLEAVSDDPGEESPSGGAPDVTTTEVEEKTSGTGSTRAFKVVQTLSIRAAPGLGARRLDETLSAGMVVECEAESCREVDGYVWWRHSKGWSAERKIDDSEFYLQATSGAASTGGGKAVEEKVTQTARTRSFKVLQPLSIRLSAGLSARRLDEVLAAGTVIDCDEESRREVDGYVWWQHHKGWSAGRKADGSVVFLGDPNAIPAINADGSINVEGLPNRGALFHRLPVDLDQVAWVQYFGNTVFAFENGTTWNYPAFAQGLHSGIDLGNNRPGGIPVRAGLEGIFIRNDPFGVAVRSGEYVIIYQHLWNTDSYRGGGIVTPDTVLGEMKPGFNHVHVEVRFDRERWIVNPLLLLPVWMREGLIQKFANFAAHFYRDARWTQWQTPLDQPVILRGGPVIGPTALP